MLLVHQFYLPVPETYCLKNAQEKEWYHYYCLDELNGIFLRFLTNNILDFSTGRGLQPPFLIFKNSNEHMVFNQIAEEQLVAIKHIPLSDIGKIAVNEKYKANDQSVIDPGFLDQISQFMVARQLKKA